MPVPSIEGKDFLFIGTTALGHGDFSSYSGS